MRLSFGRVVRAAAACLEHNYSGSTAVRPPARKRSPQGPPEAGSPPQGNSPPQGPPEGRRRLHRPPPCAPSCAGQAPAPPEGATATEKLPRRRPRPGRPAWRVASRQRPAARAQKSQTSLEPWSGGYSAADRARRAPAIAPGVVPVTDELSSRDRNVVTK